MDQKMGMLSRKTAVPVMRPVQTFPFTDHDIPPMASASSSLSGVLHRSTRQVKGMSGGFSPNNQPVFVGRDDQAFTVGALHCRLRRLREKHSELKGFSFHKLRHTRATHLARLKVPERVAQAILGHSSTLMTRYYTATDKDEMIEAVERLAQATEEG